MRRRPLPALRHRMSAFGALAGAVAAALLAGCTATAAGSGPRSGTGVRIEGIVWQPDTATREPRGDWHLLGARRLLVQWTSVGAQSLIDGCDPAAAPNGTAAAAVSGERSALPDWARIAREPWAHEVVLGLAGEFDEATARRAATTLATRSQCLAVRGAALLGERLAGHYVPIEVDPGWAGAANLLAPLLAQLPRPLWISVYDSANGGPNALADSLAGWLPPDVGLYFQDGVGVHARDAAVARAHVHVLQRRFGAHRVRLIAEAFRPGAGGTGFRAATIDELRAQLGAYAGMGVWLFDGPHYVSDALVDALCAEPGLIAGCLPASQAQRRSVPDQHR